MNRAARAWPLLAVAGLAGCVTPPPPPATPEVGRAARPPERPEERPSASRRAAPYLKELPDRPLNAAANCRFADPDGYSAHLTLGVREAKVQQLDAQVVVPAHGVCRFLLDDFTQTATRPVTLKHRKSDCTVHLWEQGRQVTIAFSECRSVCNGGAQDYLWPILVNTGSGDCS